MEADPTETDPDKYTVVFENDRVRVLEYRDRPGDRTSPHRHPDSVMVTLSTFERRLIHNGEHRDVKLDSGRVNWLAAQEHSGENVGSTETHVLFVELKEPPARPPEDTTGLVPPAARASHRATRSCAAFALRQIQQDRRQRQKGNPTDAVPAPGCSADHPTGEDVGSPTEQATKGDLVSITDRFRATWSAISKRRATNRNLRGEQEVKRRAARAHRDRLQRAESPARPDGGGPGGVAGTI